MKPVKLDTPHPPGDKHEYWQINAASLDEALALYKKRFPHFPPKVYYYGNKFYFLMAWRRQL